MWGPLSFLEANTYYAAKREGNHLLAIIFLVKSRTFHTWIFLLRSSFRSAALLFQHLLQFLCNTVGLTHCTLSALCHVASFSFLKLLKSWIYFFKCRLGKTRPAEVPQLCTWCCVKARKLQLFNISLSSFHNTGDRQTPVVVVGRTLTSRPLLRLLLRS